MRRRGLGRATEVPAQRCGHCGAELCMASGFGHDRRPQPGDLTVCLHCATVHQFAADLSLVAVEVETMPDVDAATKAELRRVQTAIHMTRPS